jgi:hypothetical protein
VKLLFVLYLLINPMFLFSPSDFSKRLYELKELQKQRKERNSNLSKHDINKLRNDFQMCILQNKGDRLAVGNALENLVSHRYNVCHDDCGEWCTGKPSYVVTALQEEVELTIRHYLCDHLLDQIYEAKNSQACESFFSFAIHFRPKYSYQPRAERGQLQRAILVHNEGWKCLLQLFAALGIKTTTVLQEGIVSLSLTLIHKFSPLSLPNTLFPPSNFFFVSCFWLGPNY